MLCYFINKSETFFFLFQLSSKVFDVSLVVSNLLKMQVPNRLSRYIRDRQKKKEENAQSNISLPLPSDQLASYLMVHVPLMKQLQLQQHGFYKIDDMESILIFHFLLEDNWMNIEVLTVQYLLCTSTYSSVSSTISSCVSNKSVAILNLLKMIQFVLRKDLL